MVNSWQLKAMLKVQKGEDIHRVERAELIERGLARFTDSHRELSLTEQGITAMTYALSPDAASKRY